MITSIIKNKTTCIFISPHLDDAVFSAGSLISALSGKVPVIVANVFTSGGDGCNSISAKAFLSQAGYHSAKKLFSDRIKEDYLVMKSLHVEVKSFGEVDALWRRCTVTRRKSFLGKIIPEFSSIYPTYRFNIISGKISSKDNFLLNRISQKISSVLPTDNYLVFCPIGIGNHVDHLIVRKACENIIPSSNLIFWSDFPYSIKSNVDNDFIKRNNLSKIQLPSDIHTKQSLCKMYKSQFRQVISDPDSLKIPETFYSYDSSVMGAKIKKIFPGKIKNYSFSHVYLLERLKSQYKFALFANSKHEKAVCKIWTNELSQKKRIELINEIAVLKQVKNTKSSLQSDVIIQKIISSDITKNYVYLLSHFVAGKSISSQTDDKKIIAYEQSVSFLQNLTKNINKRVLTSRSNFMLLIMGLYYGISIIFRMPETALEIFLALINMIFNYQFKSNLVFVHRDLVEGNILISKGKPRIIDFQLATLSNKYYDLVVILLSNWSDNNLSNRLIKELIIPKVKTSEDRKNFRFMCLVAGLCEVSIQKTIPLETSLNFLKFANRLNSAKTKNYPIYHYNIRNEV